MASLTKKIIRGKPYYYLRECKRVNGKPKIVWTYYLGSSERLLERLTRPQPLSLLTKTAGLTSRSCLPTALNIMSKQISN